MKNERVVPENVNGHTTNDKDKQQTLSVTDRYRSGKTSEHNFGCWRIIKYISCGCPSLVMKFQISIATLTVLYKMFNDRMGVESKRSLCT